MEERLGDIGEGKGGEGRLTQIVQCKNSPNKRRQINNHPTIVPLRPERLAQLDITPELRQKPHHFLQLIRDLMVDRQTALPHRREIFCYLAQAGVQTSQGRQLGSDARTEGFGGE